MLVSLIVAQALLRVAAKFNGGPSPVFTRASPANWSPSSALLPLRSHCLWTSGAIEPFCCQFLHRVRVFSVPASRLFNLPHHSLAVYACARLLSPPMISDLCSGQTHSCTPTRNWIRAQATVSVACLQSARGIPVCSVRAALLPKTPCPRKF